MVIFNLYLEELDLLTTTEPASCEVVCRGTDVEQGSESGLNWEVDPVICHCLQVGESTVRDVVARCPLVSLREISELTGAGSGCTACHRHIRQLLSAGGGS